MNTITHADCLEYLSTLPDCSVDSCVTDPPYHLTTGKKGGSGEASVSLKTPHGRARVTTGFMGMKWDGGDIANRVEMWAQVLRVLKPGGHLLSFGGTRTHHRMVCAIEDAGFEIRDEIQWLYGSGFPKSLDVSKAIDKAAGAQREVIGSKGTAPDIRGNSSNGNGISSEASREKDRLPNNITAPCTDAAKQWDGWGTALKPACEPICVARKPLIGTVAENVQQHGTGALNIDGCRIDGESTERQNTAEMGYHGGNLASEYSTGSTIGRWPANVIHDGSEEVLQGFPVNTDAPAAAPRQMEVAGVDRGDNGSAARFFYEAKASRSEREHFNNHATVKPLALMRYLVRLVTPPGGIVLDHFAGSGTTLVAARQEGFQFLGCEMEERNVKIIEARLALELPFSG